LVVRDMNEARMVCEYIEQKEPGAGSREQFLTQFKGKMTPGFDPDRDLQRIGVANQTTMLSGESLAIASEVGKSMARRWGEAAASEHFRTFDTICSATQERQDAVLKLIATPRLQNPSISRRPTSARQARGAIRPTSPSFWEEEARAARIRWASWLGWPIASRGSPSRS